MTSDGGLLAYRELDDTLELFNSAFTVMSDKRTGRNVQHDTTNLFRSSVYSCLAGYEDANDAHRLSIDPVMRAVTGKKKNAASWQKKRRVVAKVEWPRGDLFPRVGFIVTNMSAKAEGVVQFYNIMQDRGLRLDYKATESWLFSFIKLIWGIFIQVI